MKSPVLLVVDGETADREHTAQVLRASGYRTRTCGDGLQAVLGIESDPPDLVISDIHMEGMGGFDLLVHVKARWPDLPVVILSTVGDHSTVVEAMQRGASDYVMKPAASASLLAAVKKGMRIRVAYPSPPSRIPEILGRTRGMVEVRRLVTLAASSEVYVFITGETGTGKELVARAIHRYSSRSAAPFVAHNCAATPHDLFESQFFGHRRGAFTGAFENHIGLLEQADGGVLLLDELESLEPSNQAKLLRVLDDGEIRPLGSSEPRRVSVRFFAATNRDEQQLIASGALRDDLYYRLRGLQIPLPSLRERREDIPILADFFLGPEDGPISPEALDALCAFSWPGNVRQLRNVIRGAKALAGTGKVGLQHLALNPPAPDPSRETHASNPTFPWPAGSTLKEIERLAILEALRSHGGNLSRAARTLGIDRSTLRRKCIGLARKECHGQGCDGGHCEAAVAFPSRSP